MNSDCIFCKIVNRTIPSYIFYENDVTMCLVDLFPRFKYQVLVIPKVHQDSRISRVDREILKELIIVTKDVSKVIEDTFEDVIRCTITVEGLEIPHFHIRIEPYTNNKSSSFGTQFDGSKATEEYMKYLNDTLAQKL